MCSLANHPSVKLSPRFCGPYQILQKFGEVAYRLDLPTHSEIHPALHVLLKRAKKFIASPQHSLVALAKERELHVLLKRAKKFIASPQHSLVALAKERELQMCPEAAPIADKMFDEMLQCCSNGNNFRHVRIVS